MEFKMNFWDKTISVKLFGKYPLYTIEEKCSELEYEGQIYNIQITPEYFNSEFDKKGNVNENKPDMNGI